MSIPIRIVCAAIIGIVLATASFIRIRLCFYVSDEIDPYVDPYDSKYWTLEVVFIITSIAVVVNIASGPEDAVKTGILAMVNILYTAGCIADVKYMMWKKRKEEMESEAEGNTGQQEEDICAKQ